MQTTTATPPAPPTPAPLPPPGAVIAAGDDEPGAAGAGSSILEALAPSGPEVCHRVHKVGENGNAGPALFTFYDLDEPGQVREKIARYGAGEYFIRTAVRGQMKGAGRKLVIEAHEATAPIAATAAAAPAATHSLGVDVARVMESMRDLMREQGEKHSATLDRVVQNLTTQAKDAQIEILKMVVQRPQTDANGMPPGIMELLLKKAVEPPPQPPSMISQLKELVQLQKIVGGGGEENTFAELAKGLGPVLAGLLAAAQGGGKPQKPMRTVSAVQGKPAAALAPPAEPVPPSEPQAEAASPDQFSRLVEAVEGMARRGVPAESAFIALEALLEPEDFDQLANFVTAPGALDQLVMIAPSLATHREWLESLAQVIAAPPAPPFAPTGDSNADQAPPA